MPRREGQRGSPRSPRCAPVGARRGCIVIAMGCGNGSGKMTNDVRGPAPFSFAVALVTWLLRALFHRCTSASARTRATFAMPTCTYSCGFPPCTSVSRYRVRCSHTGSGWREYKGVPRPTPWPLWVPFPGHVPQGAHCTDPAVLLLLLFCLAPVVGCRATRIVGRCRASSLVEPPFLSTD